MESLVDFTRCHALWTKIEEVHGDHDAPPSLHAPLSDFKVRLHSFEQITHVCEPLEFFEILDEVIDAFEVLDPSSEKVDHASLSPLTYASILFSSPLHVVLLSLFLVTVFNINNNCFGFGGFKV